jgi:hypothetical protein
LHFGHLSAKDKEQALKMHFGSRIRGIEK